ncbi:MAG: CHAT domain-containing protein [Rhizonema sp. PD37]|nr:CHAT domain-containing protein [Rhizonema sp. PD37]
MYKLAFLVALTQFATATSPMAFADTVSHPQSLLKQYIAALQVVAQPSDAKQLLQQGLTLYQTEQFSQAESVFQQAVAAFKTQGDMLNQALALNYVALTSQQVEHLPLASKAILEGVAILQNNHSNSKEFRSVLAQALNTQGQIQLAQGQPDKAVASWMEATTLYTKNQDNAGVIGSKINQAQALQALGLYRRALLTLNQVNQQLQQQPDSEMKATGLLSLGNALRVVGNLDNTEAMPSIPFNSQQASQQRLREVVKRKSNLGFESIGSLQALEQSLKVASKLNSPELMAQIQLSLGNTAQALRSTSDRKEESTNQALQHYEQAAATGLPITRLQAQLNQLRLLVQINRWTDTQILLPQIQSQLATLPPNHKTIYALINVTQTLACLKQRTEANLVATNPNCPQLETDDKDTKSTKSLQPILTAQTAATPEWTDIANIGARAVEQAKTLGDKRAEAYALGTLGGLYEQKQDLPSAQTLTQKALVLAESIPAPDIGYRWQWQLGRILKKQGNQPGAIAAYTKAVDNLKTLRNDLVNINPDVQYSFREGVEPVYRELVSLLLEHQTTKNSLATARNVIESLRLAELDNFFRRACINAKPVNIDKVDPTAAVIYPVVLSDRLEVIVSLPSSSSDRKSEQILLHHSIPISQKDVKETITEMRQTLETRSTYDFLPSSQKVYNWIIRPIESELAKHKVKNLVFVLDNPLGNIPMEALHDGKQYLIQKYNVSLTPGLQLLNPQPLARTQLRIIAGGLSEGSNNFPALPNVKNELEAIKLKLSNTRVLLNQQFTKEAIENTVKSLSAPVVHLATHGTFSSKAEGTYIVTYDGNVNVNELNGLLKTRETNQRGVIELLVLSACSTAAGDQRAALGIAGVAVRSGARSTLASLWTVDDEATSLIMAEFYKQLNEPNISKTEAFKRAQVNMLKNPLYQHPYYWSPYVLLGNWL